LAVLSQTCAPRSFQSLVRCCSSAHLHFFPSSCSFCGHRGPHNKVQLLTIKVRGWSTPGASAFGFSSVQKWFLDTDRLCAYRSSSQHRSPLSARVVIKTHLKLKRLTDLAPPFSRSQHPPAANLNQGDLHPGGFNMQNPITLPPPRQCSRVSPSHTPSVVSFLFSSSDTIRLRPSRQSPSWILSAPDPTSPSPHILDDRLFVHGCQTVPANLESCASFFQTGSFRLQKFF